MKEKACLKEEVIDINGIKASVWGEKSQKVYIFIHGKMGNRKEGEGIAKILCPKGFQVMASDLPGHGERKNEADRFYPWYAVPELKEIFKYAKEHWKDIYVIANSIGAYFSMLSLKDFEIKKCLFISPIVNMVRLIENMMKWAEVSEGELKEKGRIPTDFGETLSWDYYTYAKEHEIIKWDISACILYGEKDNLTELETIKAFCERHGCDLTVMKGGEHWFHTEEQRKFMEEWILENI